MTRTVGVPVWLRFAAATAAYGLLLLGLRASPAAGLLAPLELRSAEVTAALLDRLGLEAERDATVVTHPAGFAYEIYYPCTGISVAGLLIVGLLAFPGRRRAKLLAAGLGVGLVGVVNQLRLLHLFYVGVCRPQAFAVVHGVWELAMLSVVVGFWSVWLAARGRSSQGSHGCNRRRSFFPA